MRVYLTGAKAGLWTDFATGGDLIELIVQARQCKKFEAILLAKEFLGLADDLKKAASAVFKPPVCPKNLVTPQDELLQYFQCRGISAQTLTKYRVGELSGQDGSTIVFPYFD